MIELKLGFWITLFIIFYSYFGYYLFLLIYSKIFKKKYIYEESYYPKVSMIIAAYNEEKVISEKIINCLNIDYPSDKIEFIIGSDGSTDRTNEIVESFDDSRIKFFPFDERRRKVSVVNEIIDYAEGEILVFSDANTIYGNDALKNLVRYFADEKVGGVCGELILKKYKNISAADEITYWNYENRLKFLESNFHSVIGATGGIYAIRKGLYEKLPEDKFITHDFFTSMNVLKKGMKFIYSNNAVAEEFSAPTIKGEFRRKVRIAFHNFNGLSYICGLLSPFKGKVAFQLWSHKISRWFLPFIFILNFIFTGLLTNIILFKVVFILYIVFFILGFIGWIFERGGIYISVFSIPYYLITVNFALIVGFFRFIFKLDKNVWKKVER